MCMFIPTYLQWVRSNIDVSCFPVPRASCDSFLPATISRIIVRNLCKRMLQDDDEIGVDSDEFDEELEEGESGVQKLKTPLRHTTGLCLSCLAPAFLTV